VIIGGWRGPGWRVAGADLRLGSGLREWIRSVIGGRQARHGGSLSGVLPNAREDIVIESSPVQRQLVGAALRRHREQLGYDLADAAAVLECDRSKISRIETGQRGIRPKELRELLAEYGVSEQEIGVLEAIVRASRAGAWWPGHGEILTPAAREYLQLEAAATQINLWAPHQVPDLLQTTGYANAIAGAARGYPAGGEPAALAALAVMRQRVVLKERQPAFIAVVDEAALHRMVGGPEVMSAQLYRLAEAARDGRHGTIRVLPFASGGHAAGIGGAVTMLGFADAPSMGVVYLPRPGNDGTSLVDQADVARYTTAFTRLTEAALSPAESARLLGELAQAYDDAGHIPATSRAVGLWHRGADSRWKR